MSRFAVDRDMAAALLDNAVDRGQAQARALTQFLGGEEGLKDAGLGVPRSMPRPVSLTASIT